MKRKIFIFDAQKEFSKNCYLISGINIYDFVFFLDSLEGETKLYIDIPFDYDEEKYITPFNKIKNYIISKRERKVVEKLYAKQIIDKYKLTKKTRIINIGTSVIMKTNIKELEISENKILTSLKSGEKLKDISVYISVHDFDWQAVCYFKDAELYNKFIEYIYAKTEIEFVNSWDELPK